MAGFHSAGHSYWMVAIVFLELAVYSQAELYIYSNSSSLCQYDMTIEFQNPSQRLDQYSSANHCFLTYPTQSSHHLAYLMSQNLVYASRGQEISKATITAQNKRLETAVEKAGVVTALSVDWVSKNIYWAEESGIIWVATYMGKFRRKLMKPDKTGNPWTINGLLAEPNEGYLYWTCSSGNIYRSELNGQHVTPFITNDVQKTMGIAIDYNENRLYWLDSRKKEIESMKTDGTERRTVATLSNAQPLGIAMNQNYVIWTDHSTEHPSVHWTPKDSRGNYHEKTLSTNAIADVILYGNYSQPETIRNRCALNSGGCSQLCLPGRLNSSQCFCGSGYKLDTEGRTCIQDTVALEYPVLVIDSLEKSLYEIDVISGKVKAIPMVDAHMNSPFAVDLDQSEGIIFWSDTGNRVIKKSDLNGRNVTTVKTFSSGFIPEGIAVDDKIKKLFYVDAVAKRIVSMDYNGRNEAVVVSNGHDSPRDIILDTNRKKIYWSDWGADQPSIKTASYTGSEERVLVDSDIKWPNGLALDDQEVLYWCDGKKGTVESIRTDGTGRSQLTSQVNSQFWGITLVGSYLYVTDEKEMYLQRILKNGSGTLEDVGDVVLLEPRGIVTVYKGKPVIEKVHTTEATVQSIGVDGKAISTAVPVSTTASATRSTTTAATRSTTTAPTASKPVVLPTRYNPAVPQVALDSLPLMVIVGICVGGVVLLAVVIAIACTIICLYRKRSNPNPQVLGPDNIYLTQPRQALPPEPQATAIMSNPMYLYDNEKNLEKESCDFTTTQGVENVYCVIPPDVTAHTPMKQESDYLIPVNNSSTKRYVRK